MSDQASVISLVALDEPELPSLLFVGPGKKSAKWLFLHPVTRTQDGERYLEQLESFLGSDVFRNSPAKSGGFLTDLFFEQVLSIATLAELRLADVEAQYHEVLVSGSEPCQLLEAARPRPQLLRGSRPIVDMFPQLVLGSPEAKALMLTYKLKKRVVGVVLLGILGVWIIIGVVVGVACNSFQVGAGVAAVGGAVFGGIVAVTTFLLKK